MPGTTILGTGHHVPGEPVTNDDLSRVMDTSDEWIRPRSGIAQRHFAAEGEGVSDLALPAARAALEAAGVDPRDIDYIIFGTMTPEHLFPGSGGIFASKLGLHGVPALDVRQQCAFFPFGIQLADGLLSSGHAKRILMVAANAHAGFMPWDWDALEKGGRAEGRHLEFANEHRATAVLFGDGAGAMVLGLHPEGEGHGYLGAVTHTDGERHDYIYIPAGGFSRRRYWEAQETYQLPAMRGRELFKTAVQRLPAAIHEVCDLCHVRLEDIDWLLAHQANDRINQAVVQALGMPMDKAPSNIARFGNTSDATLLILADELLREGRVQKGDLCCFFGLGAGLNWGAVLLRL
ncbi:MAG: 3-oxoacyl-ACP synthase III family protein [Sandaracinaceae bacterium]